MENSRFEIQDPGFQKSLPEKQQITVLYYNAAIGHNQNELLRVLFVSKAPTQRTQRVSVTSVFSLFSAIENTEKKTFAAQQVPAKKCYRLGPLARKHFVKRLKL
jgi:hypothetical protein